MSPADISILIVDDDTDLLSALEFSFRVFGFNIHSAENGHEALKILSEDDFHIVITDIKMPDMDGYELLKQIRSTGNPGPKVFLMTGYECPQLKEVFAMGADGLFIKPFESSEIKRCIRNAFLDKTRLWSDKPKQTNQFITKKFESFDDLLNSREVGIGRGGFFFVQDEDLPKVGDIVSFDIEIIDKKPFARLQGSGKVLWVNSTDGGAETRGFALETLYLSESCCERLVKWVDENNIVPFIPNAS